MTHIGRRAHAAYYGNAVLKRGYCSECNGYAFIVDGKFKCCDAIAQIDIYGNKRMMESPTIRSLPPRSERTAILRQQQDRCFYCDRLFGSIIYRGPKEVVLRLCWDHVIPWVYSLSNRTQNFVASCHVCNSLKGSLMFNSYDDARLFLYEKWKAKGYSEKKPMLELQRDFRPET